MKSKNVLCLIFCLSLVALLNSLYCGRSPSGVQNVPKGDIILRILFSEINQKESITCDSLVVEISAPDMGEFRNVKAIVSKTNFNDTVKNVPAGKNRQLKIYTVDKSGNKIHIDTLNRLIDIVQNKSNLINATLILKLQNGNLILDIIFPDALKKKMVTSCDSLIVEIYAPDMDSIRWKKRFTQGVNIKDTVPGIPAGRNRRVVIYTIDKSGTKIHIDSLRNRSIEIIQNTNHPINVILVPAAGSLYFQIANVHTSVESLIVSFVSTDKTWEKRVKRNLKVNLSLDNIPDGTVGFVNLVALNINGDTVYQASSKITFDATTISQKNLELKLNPGTIGMNLTMRNHGVSLVSVNILEPDTLVEKGNLIITEILYDSPDSLEYIEIYNPSNSIVSIDTMIIDVDNTLRKFTNISIGAHGFYIFGRSVRQWIDKKLEPQSFLDLSQGGNQIAIRSKDSSLIDQVIFAGGSNPLEWPNAGKNKSIFLDSTKFDVTMNNFGRNWFLSDSLIAGSNNLFGSPHRK